MTFKKSLFRMLTVAPVLAALLAVPVVSHAADPAKPVKCQIKKDGKTEVKEVKSAEECTKMGGKVLGEKPKSME